MELERNGVNGADVLRDVVAPGSVTTGEGVFESTLSIDQGAGHAIDFGFDGEWDFLEPEILLQSRKEI